MISRCSGAAFILADATKINYVHQFVVAKPDSFAYLVTDTRVPAEQIEEFEEKGILVKQLNPLLNYKKMRNHFFFLSNNSNPYSIKHSLVSYTLL